MQTLFAQLTVTGVADLPTSVMLLREQPAGTLRVYGTPY